MCKARLIVAYKPQVAKQGTHGLVVESMYPGYLQLIIMLREHV